MSQKWVAPAGLTLPGHHASFVFRLRKHETTIADSADEASQKTSAKRQICGGIGGRLGAQVSDSLESLKKEPRHALA